MDAINVLLEYLLVFKDIEEKHEKNVHLIKDIDRLISILENAKNRGKAKIEYIVDYNLIQKLAEHYDANLIYTELFNKVANTYDLSNEDEIKTNDNIPNYLKDILNNYNNKGRDNIMYDMMLNVNRYNVYFMNKKVKKQDLPLDADIATLEEKTEVDIEKHILPHIDANVHELDKDLVTDLKRYADVDKFRTMATAIKNEIGPIHALYEKIEDKNVLASILLHSDLETIKSVYNVFENIGNSSLSNVAANIPSIFIKKTINSKCKYEVVSSYDAFMKNSKIISDFNLNLNREHLLKLSVFLVNDFDKNMKSIERLQILNVNVKNVLEHVGNILAIKPNIVFKNIDTLALYGVKLTDDNNNYGYSLLGMEELDLKLDYLIEQGLWKKSDGIERDNIDLIRGLIIKDDYLKWKNNFKCDKLNNTSLEKKEILEFSKESLDLTTREMVLDKYPEIKDIDACYLIEENDFYVVQVGEKVDIVSRNRILRNLNNYRGKSDFKEAFRKALNYQSNLNNSEEVFSAIMPSIEMGDESVKLS